MRFTKQSIIYWGAVIWDAYLAHKGYFILGYTKSGTNWIRNLLRSYFDIDYPTKEGYRIFRKDGGKSGTWKNYFSIESAKTFNHYAGDLLIDLEYEKDKNWVQQFEK